MSVWLIVAPVQLLLHDLQPPPPPRVSAVVAVAVDGWRQCVLTRLLWSHHGGSVCVGGGWMFVRMFQGRVKVTGFICSFRLRLQLWRLPSSWLCGSRIISKHPHGRKTCTQHLHWETNHPLSSDNLSVLPLFVFRKHPSLCAIQQSSPP